LIHRLAASTLLSDTPAEAAIPLSVSPDCTVCVLAMAGPAARPAMTMPAPAAVIIRVCTFMKLLVRILITAAQRTQGSREDANSAGAGFTWVNAESPVVTGIPVVQKKVCDEAILGSRAGCP
jgi:hypothetical protein